MFQKQASEELQSSLNKIINEEVSKYSKKMTETTIAVCNNKMSKCKAFTEKWQQQLNEKQALIDNLQLEKENLENQLTTCSNQIDNQQKQILAQQNDQEKNFNQEQALKSFEKTISDLKSQIAEAEQQNELIVSNLCYWRESALETDWKYEETEHQLRYEIDRKDYYRSLYQSEMKAHDLLKSVCQEQANVHQSQLNDRAKEIETLKKDLATASSELERVKLKSRTIEDRTYYNALNADEYELSLNEKDSKIQEYLEIINAKDAQILSQKPCCPVCLTDLDENEKMIAFYRCGHRACSECFDEFPVANKPGTTHDYKCCPICEAWIIRSMVLADT